MSYDASPVMPRKSLTKRSSTLIFIPSRQLPVDGFNFAIAKSTYFYYN